MPDYTKELDEIVRLLSRPAISPWLLSAFSVCLGFIVGAIGQAIAPLLSDISRRSRMRRVLYGDIAHMFFHADTITMFGERWANDGVRDDAFKGLVSSLDFEGEEHIKTNHDVFAQLVERPATKHIYNLFHQIVVDGPAEMARNCLKVQWMLGYYIQDGALQERYFRKCLPKNQLERLLARATGLYVESLKRTQDPQLGVDR